MYQTIVLSPTSLRYFENGILEPKVLDLIKHIQTEILAIDSENVLHNEYLKIIASSEQSDALKRIWTDLLFRLKFQPIMVSISERDLKELSKLESEVMLANATDWKIILAHETPEFICKNIMCCGIEPCNPDEYLKPSRTSRVRAEEHIELKPGDQFNFREWLRKYIQDAKRLEIADGYIGKEYAFSDLLYILQIKQEGIPVVINTLTDNARCRSRDPNSIPSDNLEIKKKLQDLQIQYPELNWFLFDDKKELETRWIKTDRFKIIPEKGLGFVKIKNNKVVKQTNLTVIPL